MSTSVRFEMSIFEGYRGARGSRRASGERTALMTEIPRMGETVETGFGNSRVAWIDWSPWADEPVFIRLEETYTTDDPFDSVVDLLTAQGWAVR